MATFGESDDKILFFNNNGPPESNRMFFWKNTLNKKTSLMKKKLWLIKENVLQKTDNHEVWNDRKLLFLFAKDQQWMEIK